MLLSIVEIKAPAHLKKSLPATQKEDCRVEREMSVSRRIGVKPVPKTAT
jgi:hypothetical protein